jgi:hypothetical protein
MKKLAFSGSAFVLTAGLTIFSSAIPAKADANATFCLTLYGRTDAGECNYYTLTQCHALQIRWPHGLVSVIVQHVDRSRRERRPANGSTAGLHAVSIAGSSRFKTDRCGLPRRSSRVRCRAKKRLRRREKGS